MDDLSSPLSSPPSSTVLADQEEQLRIERLTRVREYWKLQLLAETSKKIENRNRLTSHFNNDNAWSIQTIKAFETLTERLHQGDSEKAKTKRNGQVERLRKDLRTALCDRLNGHRPRRLDGRLSPKFGATDELKDRSVREEVETLINGLDTDTEDSEEAEEEMEIQESRTVEGDKTQTNANEITNLAAVDDAEPEVDGPHTEQESIDLITTISANWDRNLPDIVPPRAVPQDIRTSPTEWPFEILVALRDLSEVTQHDDADVRRVFQKEFKQVKKHSLEKSMEIIQAVHAFFVEKQTGNLAVGGGGETNEGNAAKEKANADPANLRKKLM